MPHMLVDVNIGTKDGLYDLLDKYNETNPGRKVDMLRFAGMLLDNIVVTPAAPHPDPYGGGAGFPQGGDA